MQQAQDELRAACLGGAPGVAVSGVVWLIAGLVWEARGPGMAFTTLFIGGVAIFPLSLLISRAFGAKAASKTNPLNAVLAALHRARVSLVGLPARRSQSSTAAYTIVRTCRRTG